MSAAFFAPLPLDDGRFDRRLAAHLLRRAGFAANQAELDSAVEQGLEATVDDLLADDSEQEAAFQQSFDEVADSLVNVADPSQVQAWWLHRMSNTRFPLREKLTLFWHGHFATSVHKVECYRRRIAGPVELVVGTVRSLGVRMPAQEMNEHTQAMGQELLAPPNVKGWDGERVWINSSTWPARRAFAQRLSELSSEHSHGPHLPLDQLVPPEINEPLQVVDRLAEVLFQGELPADTRRELADFLVATEDGPNADAFRDDEGFRFDKTRQALAVMLSLPEYHTW